MYHNNLKKSGNSDARDKQMTLFVGRRNRESALQRTSIGIL